MEPRNVKVLLFDVEKACEQIQKFISDRSLTDFLSDAMPGDTSPV